MTSLISCGSNTQKIADLGKRNGELRAINVLPAYPADCKTQIQNGVKRGEPLDVAILRLNNRLAQSAAQTSRCAQWYEHLRVEFQDTTR